MAHDVFISYAKNDKPTADAVCARLEAAHIRCWIAPRDIIPGVDWGESIIDAIVSSRAMVLVFSAHVNASLQVKREVERAVHHGISIIPLRIEDVQPTKSLEFFLSMPHWLDAFTEPLDRHLQYLVEVLQRILTEPAPVHRGVEKLAADATSKEPNAERLRTPGTPAQELVSDAIVAVSESGLIADLRPTDLADAAVAGKPHGAEPRGIEPAQIEPGFVQAPPVDRKKLPMAAKKRSKGFWVAVGVVALGCITVLWSGWFSNQPPEPRAAVSSQPLLPTATVTSQPPPLSAIDLNTQAAAALNVGNCRLALSLYSLAAAKGNADAELKLGLLYDDDGGLNGVPEDYGQAFSWLQKAAAQGSADAEYNIGLLYANGHGVTLDNGQALNWFQKSAAQGNADAEFHIGLLDENLSGVGQNIRQASDWFQKAARQRNADPEDMLDHLNSETGTVTKDCGLAPNWLQELGVQGDFVLVTLVKRRNGVVRTHCILWALWNLETSSAQTRMRLSGFNRR